MSQKKKAHKNLMGGVTMKKIYFVIITCIFMIAFSLPAFAEDYNVGKIREYKGVSYKIGDVNQDGQINAQDALEILQCAARIKTCDDVFLFIGNTRWSFENFEYELEVNGYYVTATEALAVLQYAAKALYPEYVCNSNTDTVIERLSGEEIIENSAQVITTVEEYDAFISDLINNYGAPVSLEKKFDENFFYEKKLVVSLIGNGLSESAEIDINEVKYDYRIDKCVLYIDAYLPAVPSENVGNQLLMFSVRSDVVIDGGIVPEVNIEQEVWVHEESVEIDKERVEVFSGTDMFYKTADELSTRTPLINIISSYSEYEEYIASVDPDSEYIIEEYSEDYFNDNVIVVVGYYAGDYSEEVSFYDIRQTVLDGKYQINIELKYSMMQLPMMRPWVIMIPFEGTGYVDEDFFVEYISVYENLPRYLAYSKATPIEADYGNKGFKILSTYEEYQEYMDLFLEANPDFEIKHPYTEEDFEYFDIVVGGFWTSSGQLELEYDETIIREEKMTISFNGRCPDPCTEDSYYFHYIFFYDRLPRNKDNIEIVTDIEYYRASNQDNE